MARPRKPSTAYEKRNARAQALGYRSYYDYRVHDHGRIPASKPAPSGVARAALRGHLSRADFLRSLREGDLIILPHGVSAVEFDEDARGGEGAYVEIVKQVLYDRSGRERTFTLRNLTRDELVDTIEEEQRRGAIFSPSPSLDQRRLVTDDEAEGGY